MEAHRDFNMPRYTDEQIKEAVENSYSYADVLRYLGIRLTGGSSNHIKYRIEKAGIDSSHFLGQGHRKGKKFQNERKTADEVLVLREEGYRSKSYLLRRCMVESGVDYICSKCGNDGTWMGQDITLQVDHINSNWLDDRLDNLCFLCPNCHSIKTQKDKQK